MRHQSGIDVFSILHKFREGVTVDDEAGTAVLLYRTDFDSGQLYVHDEDVDPFAKDRQRIG